MRYRQLKGTDLRPSILGLGCASIASLSTAHPRREVLATLGTALDEGVTFFDTANVYGQGDSERMLGRLVSGRRDRVILCTKAGLTLGAQQMLIRGFKPLAQPLIRRWKAARRKGIETRRRRERQCFDPIYIGKQIEGSLRRLGTDYVDLFLLHNPPSDLEAKQEVIDVLERKCVAGQVRYFGVSCRGGADALSWLDQPGISCLQLPGNVFEMADIESVLTHENADRVGVVCREPFGGGAVLQDPRLRIACANDERRHSPAGLVLGMLLDRDGIDVVLAGVTCRRHLAEALAAVDAPPAGPRALESIRS